MQDIRSERLVLLAFTLERAEAALHGRKALEKLIGARVTESWPGQDFAEVLPTIASMLRDDPERGAWARFIVSKADKALVGDIGFHSTPDESGVVEVGYSVVPEYRNRGYASEAACAIVEWALHQPGVLMVTAECYKDNAASIRVLQKTGLTQTGETSGTLLWTTESSDRQENQQQ